MKIVYCELFRLLCCGCVVFFFLYWCGSIWWIEVWDKILPWLGISLRKKGNVMGHGDGNKGPFLSK